LVAEIEEAGRLSLAATHARRPSHKACLVGNGAERVR